MKKLMIAVIIAAFTAACIFAVAEIRPEKKFEYYHMKIRVKELLKKPIPDSEPAFVFPIEIALTGVSKDRNWFRFRVSYDLVFFGKYDFEGWCNVDPWKPFEKKATPEVIELE